MMRGRKTWEKKWNRESLKLLKIFEKADLKPTRWACNDTMRLMGIEEDVRNLLIGMGLASLATMDFATYKEPTIHFFSSLQEDMEEQERNQFTFMLMGEKHTFTIEDFCNSLNIGNGSRSKYPSYKGFKKKIWRRITNLPIETGKVRTSKVRNPAIRYTLHLLSNTVFARKEGSRIETQEIHLLYRAFSDYLGEGDEFRNVNNGMVIIRWMLKLRDRIKASRQHTLCFGGILTPLFVKLGIDLSSCTEVRGIQKVDVAWLSNAKSCGGLSNKGVYIHKLSSQYVSGGYSPRYIALPLVEKVRLISMENIEFRFTDIPTASRNRERIETDSD